MLRHKNGSVFFANWEPGGYNDRLFFQPLISKPQAPRSKLQRSSKSQAPSRSVCCLELDVSLELGVWSFRQLRPAMLRKKAQNALFVRLANSALGDEPGDQLPRRNIE